MSASLPDSKPAPGPIAVRGAVARICDSRAFRSAPGLRAFLCFVVDLTLADDTRSIKAYTVAVEALGRAPDFDPARDAIVRVEAGRLRTALARYYDGANDPVVISLPRGRYVPQFRWREPGPGPEVGARSDAERLCAERLVQRAQFRSHLAQIRSSVRELHAELAISKAAMARSQRIVERSRGGQEPVYADGLPLIRDEPARQPARVE